MNIFTGHPLVLAPLAGISETVFRRLCKRFGADILVSEMVSAEGILHGSRNTRTLTAFDESERPIGIQIFGSDPGGIAQAAAWIEEHVTPDFIDLNCGCPVPKVIRRNGGAALLRDRSLYERILKGLRAAVSLPCTVKIRSGWNRNEWVDIDYARIAEDRGMDAITVHPRSKTMGFSGHALWDRIAEVKRAVSIPVIGNGDVTRAQDALDMFEQTGCDAVMIGRGAFGNPWLFRDIKQCMAGSRPEPPAAGERGQTLRGFVEEYRQTYGEARAARELKKHLVWFIKGFPGAAAMRGGIVHAKSTDDYFRIIEML